MQTLKLLENNFTEGQAKFKNIDIGAGRICVRAKMIDGHDIHHSPLLPWPLMCPRLILACRFHITGERWRYVDTYRTGGRLTRLIEQAGGVGEVRELEEDRFSISSCLKPQILCCAQKSLTHLIHHLKAFCRAAEKKWGVWIVGGVKTREASLLLLPTVMRTCAAVTLSSFQSIFDCVSPHGVVRSQSLSQLPRK